MTDHYTYRVTWSPDDGEYAGLCAEFPSLSWLAATAEEAFSGIRALVHEVLSDMHANAETPPAPLADRAYSGKFLVRVPPETHRALVLRAAEEGVSLNRLVSAPALRVQVQMQERHERLGRSHADQRVLKAAVRDLFVPDCRFANLGCAS